MVNPFKKKTLFEQEEEAKRKLMEIENKRAEEERKKAEEEYKERKLNEELDIVRKVVTKQIIKEKPKKEKIIKKSRKEEIKEENENILKCEKEIKRLEEEKVLMLKQQRKDLNGAMIYGAILLFDLVIIGIIAYFNKEFIKWFLPIETIKVVFVIIPIIGFLYANKKANEKFMKTLKRFKVLKTEEKFMEDEVKRLGIIKRQWLRWRIYDLKCKLDEYKESNNKVQKIVGRVKGKETKTLIKIKDEIIENILLWKEDFVINKINEEGNTTEEPVDEEFLKELELNELYESYFLPGVLSLEKFINGNCENEIQRI